MKTMAGMEERAFLQPTNRLGVRPGFSETEFAALATSELVARGRPAMVAVPFMPSTRAERAAPFDLRVPLRGFSLFLQFKRSHRMLRRSAGQWASFGGPYYRFGVYRPYESPQHNRLAALGRRLPHVYYCAPEFHTERELERHFFDQTIMDAAVLLPTGKMPFIANADRRQHYVAFARSSPTFDWGFFSEARAPAVASPASQIFAGLKSRVLEGEGEILDALYFTKLYGNLVELSDHEVFPASRGSSDSPRVLGRAINALATLHFGARWIIVAARAR